MYLYGKNSILERLKADPKSIKEVFVQNNFNVSDITSLVKSKKIPLKSVSERELLRIKRADRPQGIVARVDNFRYADFDELLEEGANKNLSFIFLDNINDPHNLGSIIRTAACFGGFAIVIPKHNSCEVTDAVMHVASGGENFVPLAKVSNTSNSLIKAKKSGYWIAGAVVEEGENISAVKLPFPLCLVMGSEGAGIRPGVAKQIDLKLSLPMKGAELSFNVAIASAIFSYEIIRQKKT